MNVLIAIPWRATPEREAGRALVVARWRALLGDVNLVHVDTDHQPFNLNAARNRAVRVAEALGAEVVAIPDADCFPADDCDVAAACRAAATDGRLHLPFTAQRYLTAEETAAVAGGATGPLPGQHGNGACYVVAPGTWWAFGGGDERFVGWGGDDDQIVAAADTLAGGAVRDWGTVLSLHHADERRPVGTAEHRPNAELAARYWSARKNPAAMRRLLEER